jgi:hypothetical protein
MLYVETTIMQSKSLSSPYMDERLNRIAALANIASYTPQVTRNYINGAPHDASSGGETVVVQRVD